MIKDLTLIINVAVPPGKRGSSRMLPSEITKTNEIAKPRIVVEKTLWRLKDFRFTSNKF